MSRVCPVAVRLLSCISPVLLLAACASQPPVVAYDAPVGKSYEHPAVYNPEVTSVERYEVLLPTRERIPYNGAFTAAFGHSVPFAPGSGLCFKGLDRDGNLLFWGVGDRGPNGDSPKIMVDGKKHVSKVFPSPDFVPRFAEIRVVRGKEAVLTHSVKLSFNGEPASGLPIPPGSTGATGELGLNDALQPLPYNPHGVDTEGIAMDRDGNLWISDEYGPFILHVDPQGHVLKRYAPGDGLPKIIAWRQPNRGMEGVTVAPSGKVYGIIQSTLDVDGRTRNKALFLRLVELDPATGRTRQFAYPVDADAYPRLGDTKIGDLTAIDDTHFALIDQGKMRNGKMRNVIYVIDISGADDISNRLTLDGSPLEYADAHELASIHMIRKQRVLDLRDLGWQPDKAEGLALIPEGFAVTNDNDFGVKTHLHGEAGSKDKGYTIENGRLHPDGQLEFTPNREATELWLVRLAKPWQAWYPR